MARATGLGAGSASEAPLVPHGAGWTVVRLATGVPRRLPPRPCAGLLSVPVCPRSRESAQHIERTNLRDVPGSLSLWTRWQERRALPPADGVSPLRFPQRQNDERLETTVERSGNITYVAGRAIPDCTKGVLAMTDRHNLVLGILITAIVPFASPTNADSIQLLNAPSVAVTDVGEFILGDELSLAVIGHTGVYHFDLQYTSSLQQGELHFAITHTFVDAQGDISMDGWTYSGYPIIPGQHTDTFVVTDFRPLPAQLHQVRVNIYMHDLQSDTDVAQLEQEVYWEYSDPVLLIQWILYNALIDDPLLYSGQDLQDFIVIYQTLRNNTMQTIRDADERWPEAVVDLVEDWARDEALTKVAAGLHLLPAAAGPWLTAVSAAILTWQILEEPALVFLETIQLYTYNYVLAVAESALEVVDEAYGPEVAIVTPLEGATVTGLTTIEATATDTVGVVYVSFYVDGVEQEEMPAAGEDTYAIEWDTSGVTAGSHEIGVGAIDAAANADYITCSVVAEHPSAPVLTSPNIGHNGAWNERTFTVTYTDADNDAPDCVRVVIDSSESQTLDPTVPGDTDYTDGAMFMGTFCCFGDGWHYGHFEASSNGQEAEDLDFNFHVQEPQPSSLTLTATGPVAVDGHSVSTITATVHDELGELDPGITVHFSANGASGCFADATGACGTHYEVAVTNAAGQAVTHFRPTAVGQVHISAWTDGGLSDVASFDAVGGGDYDLSLSIRPVSIGDTVSTYELKARVLQQDGLPPDPPYPVTFEATLGELNDRYETLAWQNPLTLTCTDWDGWSYAHLRANSTGDAYVTFEYDNETVTILTHLHVGPIPAVPLAFSLSGAHTAYTEALDAGGDTLAAYCFDNSRVYVDVFSTQTWSFSKTIPTSIQAHSQGFAVDDNGHWSFETAEGAFIDLFTDTVVDGPDDVVGDAAAITANGMWGAAKGVGVSEVFVLQNDDSHVASIPVDVAGTPRALSFSPDGSRLAISYRNPDNDPRLEIYRTSNWSRVATILGQQDGKIPTDATWSPDSQVVAWSDDKNSSRVRMITRDGGILTSFTSTIGDIIEMDWAPSTAPLASLALYGDGGVAVHDPTTGAPLYELQGEPGASSSRNRASMAWACDGNALIIRSNPILVFTPYDAQAPGIVIHEPLDGTQTAQSTIVISGLAADDIRVDADSGEYRINGGVWTAYSIGFDGGFSFAAALESGLNTFEVCAEDYLDQRGCSSVQVSRLTDTIPPSISNITFAPPEFEVGSTAQITAHIRDDWSGVDPATPLAEVLGIGQGVVASIALYDDGMHGDGGAGDGVFGSTWDTAGIDEGEYQLRVSAADNEGNGASVAHGQWLFAYDYPVISDVAHAPAEPTNVDDVTVTASVTDSTGLSSVLLRYETNGAGSWTTVAMISGTDNSWSTDIPRLLGGGSVEYYVEATDVYLNEASSATYDYTVTVIQDCNGDLVPDAQNLAECDGSAWCSDCNGNGILDECDITDCDPGDPACDDCNGNGTPDECDLAPIWSEVDPVLRAPESNGQSGAEFGSAVTIAGNVAAVGARYEDGANNGTDSGAVYVFRKAGESWGPPTRLVPSDGQPGDNFGSAVALDADVLVVGALKVDAVHEDAGAAYVFRYTAGVWSLEQRLLPEGFGTNPGDSFGQSVAVHGNVIAIGALWDDENGTSAGAAYVYRFLGGSWVLQRKLLGEAHHDSFGTPVSVSGSPGSELVAVGARYHDTPYVDAGAAYICREIDGQWEKETKLTAVDAAPGDEFGRSVDIDGDSLVVGAWYDADCGYQSGSAYMYRFGEDGWHLEAKLRPPNGHAGQRFGFFASIAGDTIAIAEDSSSTAHVFRRTGTAWQPAQTLVPSGAFANDGFGWVSVCGDDILLGVRKDAYYGALSGAAYLYALGPGASADCNGTAIPDECETVGSGDFNADGHVDGDDFVAMAEALTGPDVELDTVAAECKDAYLAAFDFDGDGDVDLADFAVFSLVFTGSQK